jgi:hypothetical protein
MYQHKRQKQQTKKARYFSNQYQFTDPDLHSINQTTKYNYDKIYAFDVMWVLVL